MRLSDNNMEDTAECVCVFVKEWKGQKYKEEGDLIWLF